MSREDELIAQYSDITGANVTEARQRLEAFEWNLEAAMEDHYTGGNDSDAEPEMELGDEPEDIPQPPTQDASGSYRLGDGLSTSQPVPAVPASSSSATKPRPAPAPSKRFATLGDFTSSARKDSDSDDDNQDMYAGGDKSGLAVKNPGRDSEDLKKKIIDKARKGGKDLVEDEPKKKSFFTGNARTLGGDDTPSQEIQGEAEEQSTARVKRSLHFWQDGFSIDDGDLFRFDDPANANVLSQIRSGRAPLHIMNVAPGQEVDVQVVPHEEKYVKAKKQYRAFEGQGQRLGSPTPATSSSAPMPGSFTQTTPAAASSTTTQTQTNQVDESKPILTLRISLGTGTRMTARFNTDQTIGDVYDYARRHETSGRDFVLQTTFPTREFKDQSQILGDVAELKRGGALVQKYT
ncbi:protein phosphatase regulator [Lithohypha guttulata]|uniref:Protein phosphatase regulator n=1 Tax=Lithohypha guttulata TaxID=1690604 RepID=A0AAN7T240_9EURO|nr:protein phosphatase regulator [Lithohypha guttulata]KAK5088147.1 protein phosphatase regulator [Lithohypha guttulata]